MTAVGHSTWNNSQPTTWLARTTMQYDAFGRKTAMTDPDMGSWSYSYDAAGSLTEQLDANSNRLCFYYDNLNRLTTKRHDNDTNGSESNDTPLANYVYYTSGTGAIGQLSEIRWTSSISQNKENFAYDTLGRLSSHSRTIDSLAYTMTYTGYDALHRPTSRTITYPNGNTETVSLTFDHEGENALVVAGATVVEAVGYNEMGQLKRLALGNGLTTWLGPWLRRQQQQRCL